jgi:Domain of unknown function (DUF1844)
MAEVQTSTNSGELAQRFIEFVMMQAQNAALFLGQIPNPQTGKGEVNLEVAKMFIDQLKLRAEVLELLPPKKKLPRLALLTSRLLRNLPRRVEKGSRARSLRKATERNRAA